jgi:hypothetical protein
MASVITGAGLILCHYIDYGYTSHLAIPDHGIVGIALVVLGGFLGVGKPGAKLKT